MGRDGVGWDTVGCVHQLSVAKVSLATHLATKGLPCSVKPLVQITHIWEKPRSPVPALLSPHLELILSDIVIFILLRYIRDF